MLSFEELHNLKPELDRYGKVLVGNELFYARQGGKKGCRAITASTHKRSGKKQQDMYRITKSPRPVLQKKLAENGTTTTQRSFTTENAYTAVWGICPVAYRMKEMRSTGA